MSTLLCLMICIHLLQYVTISINVIAIWYQLKRTNLFWFLQKNSAPRHTRSRQNRPSVLLCIESLKAHPMLWRILRNLRDMGSLSSGTTSFHVVGLICALQNVWQRPLSPLTTCQGHPHQVVTTKMSLILQTPLEGQNGPCLRPRI